MKTNIKKDSKVNPQSKNKDELFAIFEKHLFHPENDADKVENLVYNVVVEYMVILMDSGNIPHQLCLALEMDLKEEVFEMFERRTIGFRNLSEFREMNKLQKSKRRAS